MSFGDTFYIFCTSADSRPITKKDNPCLVQTVSLNNPSTLGGLLFTNLGYFYLAYTLAGFQTVSSSHLNLHNQHLTLISTKLLLPSLQNVLAHLFSPCYFMHYVFYSFLIYALLDYKIIGSKIPSAHTFHFA